MIRRTRDGAFMLLLLLAATFCFAGDGSGELPPGYVSETLDNGLRVSILADPDNTVVATRLWYHVGSANEEAHSRGTDDGVRPGRRAPREDHPDPADVVSFPGRLVNEFLFHGRLLSNRSPGFLVPSPEKLSCHDQAPNLGGAGSDLIQFRIPP